MSEINYHREISPRPRIEHATLVFTSNDLRIEIIGHTTDATSIQNFMNLIFEIEKNEVLIVLCIHKYETHVHTSHCLIYLPSEKN